MASASTLFLAALSPEKATPEGLRKHLEAEVARWDKVIKAAGVSAE